MAERVPATPVVCGACGTQIAPSLLSCPSCQRLVHAETLRELAAAAARQQQAGELAAALESWRRALALLPASSRQSQQIGQNIADLEQHIGASGTAPERSGAPAWARVAGPLGVLALLVWKFKFVVAFVLTKGKLLLLGMTKFGTVASMFLSVGVYWTAWGWRFAVGLVAAIYVHEIGHVAALRRYGIPASAPMFVPGLGAFVKHAPLADPRREARVALAGPTWGFAATVFGYLAFLATGSGYWAALTEWSARINLFNLIAIPPLDGAKGFAVLSNPQRWLVVLVVAATWAATGEGMLSLVLIVAAVRAFGSGGGGDQGVLLGTIALVIGLAALSVVRGSVPG